MGLRIYSLIFALALPFLLLRLLLREGRRPGGLAHLSERFGLGAPPLAPGGSWVHAVSVGEVVAAAPLLRRLHAAEPSRPLLLTVVTASGRARAEALVGDIVTIRWLPFDLPWCIDALLRALRPRLLLLVETELWPNLIARAAARDVRVAVLGARLSARSARRYGRAGALLRATFRRIDLVLCQDRAGARRFRALGVPPERTLVTGSLKFEPSVPADLDRRLGELREALAPGARPVVVAGSTHAGEERFLVDALKAHWMRAAQDVPATRPLLVLAPRHLERVPDVLALCAAEGVPATQLSKVSSAGKAMPQEIDAVVVDSMGVLFALYGVADIAFVGGSLAPSGGHNPVEAAWHGVPVLMGPGVRNVADPVRRLGREGALQALGAEALTAALHALLANPQERRRRGAAAARAVRDNGGSLERSLRALAPLLAGAQSPEVVVPVVPS